MRIAFILCVCAVVIAGCDTRSKELEKQNAELQAKNNEIYKELTTRDEYIEQVMAEINAMHESLQGSREKEKLILSETNKIESVKKASSVEIRQQMLDQLAEIDSGLKNNKKKLSDLQARVSSNRKQIAGLNKMVESLKQTIEEREQSIAALETRVKDLETEVSNKSVMIAQRDSTINEQQSVITQQTSKINTGFYIIGTRGELERQGIIKDEGGFLWGLFGSTATLTSGFDKSLFKPINKTRDMMIQVDGTIDEILPKRNLQYYSTNITDRNHTSLQIVQPESFWQDNYLVIIKN
jgi:uncharacterized coiled-coil protein SlyX